MKKLIIFVSLLFLAMAYGKAEDKEVLKIATFNLRMDTPSDGENAWFHRKDMVNDLIWFRFIRDSRRIYASIKRYLAVKRLPVYWCRTG